MSELDDISLKYACDKRWEDLAGFSSRVRHCGACKQNVFNLSGMTRKQAREFLAQKEGRGQLCVRFVRRDGVIAHEGDPLAQLEGQRSGATALLVAALAVHGALGIFVEGYELDPFEAVARVLKGTQEERIPAKFGNAQASVEMGIVY